MKAIVVHQYGDPEVLKYEDVPRRASEGKQAR
jgi:NADPH:quinone reductase-like Zn-dependent oxidoreductase